MSGNKVKDRDYLFLTAMLRAREADMLDRDRMDRMLSAPGYADAAKLLTDCGYPDLSAADAKGVDAALSAHRKAIFDEISRMAPEQALTDAFRLKYDYHNAKVIIKAEGAHVAGEHLLSDCGRVPPEMLHEAYVAEKFSDLPPALGAAMAEARDTLARTGNPQLADFVLDRAFFAELTDISRGTGSQFLIQYAKLQIDGANLRAAVRTVRMGRGQDFLRSALIPGGAVAPDRLAQSAAAGGEGLAALYVATCLSEAAALGAEAMKGGSMTRFELACDNALTAYLASAGMIAFGREPVTAYLAMAEAEITAVRMILTGRLAGIAPEVIRERLRDLNA